MVAALQVGECRSGDGSRQQACLDAEHPQGLAGSGQRDDRYVPRVCPGSSHTTHLFGPVDCGPHTEGRWRAGTRPGPSREEYTSAGEFRDSPPVRGTNLVGVP
jgi:hypothetical protein